MKVQNNSNAPKQSIALQALERIALASATVGANSACAYIFHNPKKPESLKQLKKF